MFLDSLGAALVYGCVVALLSIGFTLGHVSSDFPHLGLVQYSVVGAYIGYTVAEFFGLSPYLGLPIAFLGGGVNAAFYLIVVATLQRRGTKDVMLSISTLTGSFVMITFVAIYAFWVREATGAFSMAFILEDAYAPIASLIVLVASALALRRLLSGTRLGAAGRGSAENSELAMVCGVNPFRIQVFSWFVAGGLASMSGLLYTLQFVGDPYLWTALFTVTFAASFLGGIDSALWAPMGALITVSAQYAAETALTAWGGRARGALLMADSSTLPLPHPLPRAGWPRRCPGEEKEHEVVPCCEAVSAANISASSDVGQFHVEEGRSLSYL